VASGLRWSMLCRKEDWVGFRKTSETLTPLQTRDLVDAGMFVSIPERYMTQ
jgi:hypothetical protein